MEGGEIGRASMTESEAGRVLEPDQSGETLFEVGGEHGERFHGRTVILTTGTSLAGRLLTGERSEAGGRRGERAATALSESLRRLGFRLGRLKTGTPPRVH